MAVAEVTRPVGRGWLKANKLKLLLGVGIVVLAITALGLNAFQGNMMYYLTVGELKARQAEVVGQGVRLAGKVQEGSIQRDNRIMTLRFLAYDEKDPTKTVLVAYRGVIPDTFKEGADVVVEGRLDANGVFQASQLFAKCPSKYEPK